MDLLHLGGGSQHVAHDPMKNRRQGCRHSEDAGTARISKRHSDWQVKARYRGVRIAEVPGLKNADLPRANHEQVRRRVGGAELSYQDVPLVLRDLGKARDRPDRWEGSVELSHLGLCETQGQGSWAWSLSDQQPRHL